MTPFRTAALPLCFFSLLVHADWGKSDYEFENEKPWKELQHALPAYPKDENLLPFYVSATTDNLFFVDAASIKIGDDGVVRYALLVKSPQGAKNLTFEGMRCASHEKKVYAFGRADGTWSQARFSKWEAISYQNRNRQHHVLYDDFFCTGGLTVATPERAIESFKRDPLYRAKPAE